VILDLRREADENCAPLGYYAVVISYRHFGTPEDGTDKLSWNFVEKLPPRNNPEERSSQFHYMHKLYSVTRRT